MTHQAGLFDESPQDDLPIPPISEPKPGRRCALFFALQPDEGERQRVGEEAQALRNSLGFGQITSALEANRLHVSLHDLGEHDTVPKERIARAMRVGQMMQRSPIVLSFDQAMARGRRTQKPLILIGSHLQPALVALHRQLGMALADVGEPARKSFTPHMTLAYVPDELILQAVPPLCWTARHLSLIWSHVGETRYEYVGRWPLLENRP